MSLESDLNVSPSLFLHSVNIYYMCLVDTNPKGLKMKEAAAFNDSQLIDRV